MQLPRALALAALCAALIVGTDARYRPEERKGKHNKRGPAHKSYHQPSYYQPKGKASNLGYSVQGQSTYEAARPKDPTPLAPTSAGPYALAHRGASGTLPEHTREAYLQAIALGADFFEADTVLTRDGHLICRHEPNLSNTTNADELFPDRIRTYTIDFSPSVGVHSVDLTLAEVRTLRARQRLFARDQSYNDMFGLITLEEYLDIALEAKRVVGVYIETKHPLWHDSFRLRSLNGKSMSQKLVEVIKRKGYGGKLDSPRWLRQPIFLQSFETLNLREMRNLTDSPVVQLLSGITSPIPDQGTGVATPNGGVIPGRTYAALVTDAGLREIAQYADAIGPDKTILAPISGGRITYTTNLVARAHALDLQVHPYTFRNEQNFFARNLQPSTIMSEFELYIQELGADGVFADFPETAVQYLKARRSNATFPRRQIFPQADTSVNASAIA